MKKKKVLFVIHQLNYGGAQKAAITALNAIDYSQNEVTLYVRKNRTQLLPEVNKKVSRIIINEDPTHYYRKFCILLLSLCEDLTKLIKNKNLEKFVHKNLVKCLTRKQMQYEQKHYFPVKEEYDVAISYISGYTAQFVAEYIKAKQKIMFYHASTDENHDVHEKILHCFDKIVGVNAAIPEILKKFYPSVAERITYIENCVDVTQIRSKGSYIFDKKSPNIICSCGRFAAIKGFDLAVEAARILQEKKIPFYWYFVGDGPERFNLERLIKKYHLTEHIEITGMQDNPYAYIENSDIYVQPSYEESFGLTISEAKILCRPIVSTKTVGGQKQIVHRETGLLTEITAEAIAMGVENYIKDNELKKRVTENLQKIDYSYDAEQYRLAWENLLED